MTGFSDPGMIGSSMIPGCCESMMLRFMEPVVLGYWNMILGCEDAYEVERAAQSLQ